MEWEGLCITGANGFRNVLGIKEEIDLIDLKDAKKEFHLDSSLEYSPWMSCKGNISDLSRLDYSNEGSNLFLKAETVKELTFLLQQDGIALKRIHNNADGSIKVIEPKSEEYSVSYEKMLEVLNLFESKNINYYFRVKKIISNIILQGASVDSTNIRKRGTGLSSFNFRGCIFLSIPSSENWKFDLLLNLVHELGHQFLIYMQMVDKIILDSHLKKIFSVIRKTERPAILSFHALVASSFMLEFLLSNNCWLRESFKSSVVQSSIRANQIAVKNALDYLNECNFTQTGRSIMSECLALYIESTKKMYQ